MERSSEYMSMALEFEDLVQQILQSVGFSTQSDKGARDSGFDFVAEQQTYRILVEVKLYRNPIAKTELLRNASQRLAHAASGAGQKLLLVVSSQTSAAFKKESRDTYGVVVWDLGTLKAFAKSNATLSEALERLLLVAFEISPADYAILGEAESVDQGNFPDPPKTKQPIINDGARLCGELRNIPAGRAGARGYEVKCIEVLKHLFLHQNELTLWNEQVTTSDGLNRNDLLCRVFSNQNNFWSELASDFGSRYVVFEFKNYTDGITQKEVYTSEKYLFLTALRSICFIIARVGGDLGAHRAASGALKEGGKLIVILDNSDLCEMLSLKDRGSEPTEVLRAKVDGLLIHLNR